jgi:exosortase
MVEIKATGAGVGFLPSSSTRSSLWPIAAALLFFAVLWFEAINQLQPEWSLNPQYGYGWTVPFLALYLLWGRWLSHPLARPPDSRVLPTALIVFCALLFFPIRFVAEANPDWRLLSWALAFVVVSMSILWIFMAGGWPWLRHFAFPIVFFLVAVPWPMHFEQVVVQGLMRAVAAINVSWLNIAGIPALQHGNVIEVGSGLIGIEEACSGVRSLQATLMISLFLGELYSLTIARRLFLVIAGILLAFFCNVLRTAVLVWMGAKNGTKSIEAWHDPAGLTILLVCLLGLWLFSLTMRRGPNVGQISLRAVGSTAPEANLPITHLRNLESSATFWPVLALLALWFLLAEAGVKTWYHLHQNSVASLRWAVSWPRSERHYQPVPIASESEALLRYNQGGGATWQTSDGHRWVMYFFRWLPGRTAALFVKIHRPDVCLPASGLTMERDNGIQLLAVNGVNLPIRSYRFDDHGAPLHVWYCYSDARSSYKNVAGPEDEDWTARGRVRAALRGFREVGAQMLELVVWGYEDDAEANDALQRQLDQIVRRG